MCFCDPRSVAGRPRRGSEPLLPLAAARLDVVLCKWEVSRLYVVLVPSELIRPRENLVAYDMRLTTVVVELDSRGWGSLKTGMV